MKEYLKESYQFLLKNFLSAIYGILFVVIIFIWKKIQIGSLSQLDTIFITIVVLQVCLLLFKVESKRDFFTIMIFHLLATFMELFKTSPWISSWQYPGVTQSIFHIYNVPLFTGFMYSAVGSYISRAQEFLNLIYTGYPKQKYVWILCALIYINFFMHHFIFDFRIFLIVWSIILYWKTKVKYQVYKKVRHMHFLLTAFLTAIVIWLVENISTFQQVWLYPDQVESWHLVSFSKVTAWYLLLIVSFGVISSLKKFKIEK